MKPITPRYINLDGTATGIKNRTLRYVFNREAGASAVIVTATSVLSSIGSHDWRYGVASLVCGTAGAALMHGLFRNVQAHSLRRLFGDINEKSIDRRPTRHTPPTSPQNIARAYNYSVMHAGKARGVMFSQVSMAMMQGLSLMNTDIAHMNATLGSFGAGACLSGLFYFISNAHTYGKVANGKWVLHDAPPPRKVVEAKKAGSIFGRFSPI